MADANDDPGEADAETVEVALLEDARAELDRQQRQLRRVLGFAVKDIQFIGLALSVVIGIIQFSDDARFEITPAVWVAAVLLFVSVFVSIAVLLLAGGRGTESKFEDVFEATDETTDIDDEWKATRLKTYTRRIGEYEARRRIAKRLLRVALATGFAGSLVFVFRVARQAKGLRTFGIPSEAVYGVILLIVVVALWSALSTEIARDFERLRG